MDCSLAVLVLSSSKISLLTCKRQHSQGLHPHNARRLCAKRLETEPNSYFLALLLLGGLLVQETLDLHVQVRRLALAGPALLIRPAPRRPRLPIGWPRQL